MHIDTRSAPSWEPWRDILQENYCLQVMWWDGPICLLKRADSSNWMSQLSWSSCLVFHPNHFCSGHINNITFTLLHYRPPAPHGDIAPGLNSVWETINMITYIKVRLKGWSVADWGLCEGVSEPSPRGHNPAGPPVLPGRKPFQESVIPD